MQVSIFTQTIPHQRAEFFFNSREVFENLFLGSSATPRDIYTAFTIQDLFERFDHICHNVGFDIKGLARLDYGSRVCCAFGKSFDSQNIHFYFLLLVFENPL